MTREEIEKLVEKECPYDYGVLRKQFMNGAVAMYNVLLELKENTNDNQTNTRS